MNRMKIMMYRHEALEFEKMLISKVGVGPYRFTKKFIRDADGWLFTIEAEKGIAFYFIGQAWMLKQDLKMILAGSENYAFRILEDDEKEQEGGQTYE